MVVEDELTLVSNRVLPLQEQQQNILHPINHNSINNNNNDDLKNLTNKAMHRLKKSDFFLSLLI